VDKGFVNGGKPLPNMPGSWETVLKPNSELEMVKSMSRGWMYDDSIPRKSVSFFEYGLNALSKLWNWKVFNLDEAFAVLKF